MPGSSPTEEESRTGRQGRRRDPAARVQERIERMERVQERLGRIRDEIVERQRGHDNRGIPRSGRERIMEQARTLFLERGFAEVSMQQIADAAGLRKASIYHHFRDKEELFSDIVQHEMEAMRHTVEGYIALGGTLPEVLERLAFAQFSQMSGNSARMARDFRDHVPESRHEEVHGELERLYKLFNGVFERAAEAGEIQGLDPRIAASSFFHTILAWSMDFHGEVDLTTVDPRQLAKMAVNTILFGIASPALRERQNASAE